MKPKNEPHEQGAKRIDVSELVEVHMVMPDEHGQPYDYHTHGLEALGHPEFQLLAPGYCRSGAVNLLMHLADKVINHGERYQGGEIGDIDGVICGYVEMPGDIEGDPPRLRIVDLPGGCHCECCGRQQGPDDHSKEGYDGQ